MHLSTKDVARILGVTTGRVIQLIKMGRIKTEKIAGVYVFTPRSVANYERKPVGRPAKPRGDHIAEFGKLLDM
jgi:hypothetical protein